MADLCGAIKELPKKRGSVWKRTSYKRHVLKCLSTENTEKKTVPNGGFDESIVVSACHCFIIGFHTSFGSML